MANGDGDCDGWQQLRQQWPTVRVTGRVLANGNAMEMVVAMCDGNGKGNGWWKLQGQWAMATATATEMETAMAITMVAATATATMTKGGLPLHVPEMCSFVAGATPCLPSHGHKGVCIHQRCVMGVTLQRVFAPFQGGGFLSAHHRLFFYFFQLLFSLLNNPLFVPHIIQALKNPVSPLMLYLLHSYYIFLLR